MCLAIIAFAKFAKPVTTALEELGESTIARHYFGEPSDGAMRQADDD
jgi:hypothetical protein